MCISRAAASAARVIFIDFAGGYMYNQREISVIGSDQYLPVKTFDIETKSYQFDIVKNPLTGEPVKGPDGQYIPSMCISRAAASAARVILFMATILPPMNTGWVRVMAPKNTLWMS